MNRAFLTLILTLMAVTGFAQVPVLTAGGHLPRGGDRIERYCIDYVLPGDSGRNVLWDKSGERNARLGLQVLERQHV